MREPFKRVFKRRFFTSIRVKFVIVYILVNVVSLQLIGLFFTTQLKNMNISNFEETIIEQEKILNYNVSEELGKIVNGSDKNQSNVTKLASEFYVQKLMLVNVIDKDGQIIASSSKNGSENYNGKKSLDSTVKQVIKTGESAKKTQVDSDSGRRVWIYVSPIKKDGTTIGAIYLMTDIELVYSEINNIVRIFIFGTLISIFVTTLIGFLASKTVTSSIEKMNSQVKEMAVGNYREIIDINTNDEIGDLAKVFNQISKKILEEQNITEAERRKLGAIISNMTDGLIATDNNGRILLINESAKNILQLAEDDIFIGKDALKTLNITEYNNIDDIIREEDSLLIESKERDSLIRAEFTEIIGEVAIDYLKRNRRDGYIIVLYDVTVQERQEQERRDFVSTVSHELRTPLTTMNSYIEALEDGAIDDKKLALSFIDTIHKETNRMIRMVTELLQLSKMDIQEEHYEKELLDINKLLEKIIERFTLTHTEKNFISYLPKEPIFVEGDQDKLVQVFDNVINNAIKYSPDGKNITLRVRQNYNQNRVTVSIKDEGVGIPLAHIDKIFDRFYRVDKSRQRSMGGTGLGLALSKKIVEAHKGKIWAQSRENYGTIIFVMLPCEIVDEEWL